MKDLVQSDTEQAASGLRSTTHKTLFSVIQTTDAEGHYFFQVDWHSDLYPALDEMTPEGVLADRLIDLAQELMDEFAALTLGSASEIER